MATLLDGSLIAFLMPLLIFLFIFVVLYALLSKTEMFGKNQALNLLASVCVAAVAVFAGNLVVALGSVIPWFVFIFVIVALIFAFYKMFGMQEKEIWPIIGGQTTIFVIILLIVAGGLALAFKLDVSPFASDKPGEVPAEGVGLVEELSAGSGIQSEAIKTITHPRLLGAIFILVIASFVIRILIVDKK